jgi:hypothetical protein
MHSIVLYCKSYRRDFLRLKRLHESIVKYNKDLIPFYISTPKNDENELTSILGNSGYLWVADEDILARNKINSSVPLEKIPGKVSQAIIKSEFWRLRICVNYVCLDSDCLFIKDFYISDFLYSKTMPYTIIYENKDFFQLAIDRGESRTVENLKKEASRVKNLFDREGQNYYCHCPPFIWSSMVWESLSNNYLEPNNLSLWCLATGKNYNELIFPETLIYLESLFKYNAIPLIPREQLFRVYYSAWHYYLLKRLGEKKENLSSNYLGILYQSNWQLEMDYGPSSKSIFSRALKKIKRFLRLIESYF